MFNERVSCAMTDAFVSAAVRIPEQRAEMFWYSQCYMESDLCYEINLKLAHILGKGE